MSDVLNDPALTWYIARATGVVTLVLLTLSLVLGIAASGRTLSSSWPRFLTQGLHRNVSLACLALLGAHIVAVVLDDYVVIGWLDAVVPFVSTYRPLWLGLGTIAFDLVIVLVVSSLVRHRLGHRGWRLVHWSAYACWPLAVVHGLGTGADSRTQWSTYVTAACVLAVVLAIGWRLAVGRPELRAWRAGAAVVTVASVVVLTLWAWQGPLAPGWSQRAGTPPPASSAGG
jgi:methionine sulfoxide reductase heme-binding subunit